jgi:hypothetical protein
MSLKKTLSIVIFAVLAVIVVFVLYLAFFKTDSNTVAPLNSPTVSKSRILPLGKNMDLSKIKKYNSDGKMFSYPLVQPTDVGPSLSEIVKAPTNE